MARETSIILNRAYVGPGESKILKSTLICLPSIQQKAMSLLPIKSWQCVYRPVIQNTTPKKHSYYHSSALSSPRRVMSNQYNTSNTSQAAYASSPSSNSSSQSPSSHLDSKNQSQSSQYSSQRPTISALASSVAPTFL